MVVEKVLLADAENRAQDIGTVVCFGKGRGAAI